ncbi:hypothetical protein L195_g037363 [Trifolium pratense]|uniref:Uncharacterized protein n=1 Tax=Trifolium pratense TaxID=57577 RepID=A0A2K3LS27_TRIPR|nr:hypothetical protein L195_g037363 [Trifolium pratense]
MWPNLDKHAWSSSPVDAEPKWRKVWRLEVPGRRDCPPAMALWLNVVSIDARALFFASDFDSWVELNLSKASNMNNNFVWADYWAVACHTLWNWRNKENHEDHWVRPLQPDVFISKHVEN